MKFTVARDVLAEAVSWTARALPVRPASPILAGVRIKAEGDGELHSCLQNAKRIDHYFTHKCAHVGRDSCLALALVTTRQR